MRDRKSHSAPLRAMLNGRSCFALGLPQVRNCNFEMKFSVIDLWNAQHKSWEAMLKGHMLISCFSAYFLVGELCSKGTDSAVVPQE
jgi:hypothetical protein